jgi:quinol monooxygenase YgiN
MPAKPSQIMDCAGLGLALAWPLVNNREQLMAIGVIATLKVAENKGAEFEAVFKELASQVRANEPGNKLYQVCKSRKEENTYIVMELYADQAALDAHGKSDHYRAAGPKLGPTLAGRPDVQFFDTV